MSAIDEVGGECVLALMLSQAWDSARLNRLFFSVLLGMIPKLRYLT